MKNAYLILGGIFLCSFFWMLLVVKYLYDTNYQYNLPFFFVFICLMQLVCAIIFFKSALKKEE